MVRQLAEQPALCGLGRLRIEERSKRTDDAVQGPAFQGLQQGPAKSGVQAFAIDAAGHSRCGFGTQHGELAAHPGQTSGVRRIEHAGHLFGERSGLDVGRTWLVHALQSGEEQEQRKERQGAATSRHDTTWKPAAEPAQLGRLGSVRAPELMRSSKLTSSRECCSTPFFM